MGKEAGPEESRTRRLVAAGARGLEEGFPRLAGSGGPGLQGYRQRDTTLGWQHVRPFCAPGLGEHLFGHGVLDFDLRNRY